MHFVKRLGSLFGILAMVAASHQPAAAKNQLSVEVYNPRDKALFAVSSEIVSGPREVVLIDAQMARTDAEALVAKIKATRKILKAVYISQSDPDFYFGLETIRAAFPRVRIFATRQTIAQINATKDGKLAYWGPVLKNDAPHSVIVPEPLKGDALTVDGRRLQIIGLDGPTPDRTFIWIPSERTVIGGTIIAANEHVFMADTQSARSRADWKSTLARVEALHPRVVVPGHYHPNPDGSEPRSVDAVRFTRDYLDAFEAEAAKSAASSNLVSAMKARYPNLAQEQVLAISAKVIKGEMKWPSE